MTFQIFYNLYLRIYFCTYFIRSETECSIIIIEYMYKLFEFHTNMYNVALCCAIHMFTCKLILGKVIIIIILQYKYLI